MTCWPDCGHPKTADNTARSPSKPSGDCRVCRNTRTRKRRAVGPRKNRYQQSRITRLRKYGLTVAEYEAKLRAQGGVCALCGRRPQTKALPVDHDHRSGGVRDLLCFACNGLVGVLETKPVLVEMAQRYLARHKERQAA